MFSSGLSFLTEQTKSDNITFIWQTLWPKTTFYFSHAHTSRGNRMLLLKFPHKGLKPVLIVFTCLHVSDGLTLGKRTSVQPILGSLATLVLFSPLACLTCAVIRSLPCVFLLSDLSTFSTTVIHYIGSNLGFSVSLVFPNTLKSGHEK